MKVSNCCRGGFIAESGNEGTGFYRCSECFKACDVIEAKESPSSKRIPVPTPAAHGVDLALVSLDELVQAIFARSDEAVVAIRRHEDAGAPVLKFISKAGNVSGVGMAATAKAFFLKNILGTYEEETN